MMEFAPFFTSIRPLFGNKLNVGQVGAMEIIVNHAAKERVSRVHLAYVLATIFHETAQWMRPIREGARRYGPAYTDRQSRNAVASIFAKGIIRRNYALPDANGNSYYGRGLVQITHKTNYLKMSAVLEADLVGQPDLALEWGHALDITFIGMRDGMFTGKSLAMITEERHNFRSARGIINGDIRKNGNRVAAEAEAFLVALAGYAPHPEKKDWLAKPHVKRWPPSWWPFSKKEK